MTAITHTCEACGATVEGVELAGFGDAFIAHVRADHKDWPYPDVAIRNYAEATQRLSPVEDRVAALGSVEIHHVTEDRIEDWLRFFDHDAFAGNPAWAACYCTEPFVMERGASPADAEAHAWQQRRSMAVDLLRSGRSFGYLAYVDGRPAGWVNASRRSEQALYREGGAADPPDGDVAAVSCYVVAPPYRQHGLARQLLERVLADAPGRGISHVEAYPFNEGVRGDSPDFHGSAAMYEEAGFTAVEHRERYKVVRKHV